MSYLELTLYSLTKHAVRKQPKNMGDSKSMAWSPCALWGGPGTHRKWVCSLSSILSGTYLVLSYSLGTFSFFWPEIWAYSDHPLPWWGEESCNEDRLGGFLLSVFELTAQGCWFCLPCSLFIVPRLVWGVRQGSGFSGVVGWKPT